MRSPDEYRQILRLWEAGRNKSEIEQITGIPRATVRDCIKRYGNVETLEAKAQEELTPILLPVLEGKMVGNYAHLHAAYAYLLGLYLGDGHLVRVRNVHRLRIFLDVRYPNIIAQCTQAMQTLFPGNQVGQELTEYRGRPSMITVGLYHRDLLHFFPQHGEGMKHERKIELTDWQQRIVTANPLEFFRGLYHSDGSRFINRVKVAGKDYEYPRYQFTNASEDIIGLFCAACDQIGVTWTRKLRRARAATHVDNFDIYISKRPDVAYLDSVIGAKS
ncbi:MAG: hypothetical protein J0M07_09265 [Anaerolineae bacterium]|nr:hypothetical protein [Anaerolineae bacterium]